MTDTQRIIAETIASAYGFKESHVLTTAENIVRALEDAGLAIVAAGGETIAPDVVEIILSDPQMWFDTIRTIARQRARLDRQLAGRRKPIEPDDVDCGVPHLVED